MLNKIKRLGVAFILINVLMLQSLAADMLFYYTTAILSALQSTIEKKSVLSSNDVANGEYMALKYGAEEAYSGDNRGQNISPHLSWNFNASAQSYAIEMIDIDYYNFIHWAIINIPKNVTELPQSVSNTYAGMQTLDTPYRYGYTGPFPPSPSTHRYKITVYALDTAHVSSMIEAKAHAIESVSITPKFSWDQ